MPATEVKGESRRRGMKDGRDECPRYAVKLFSTGTLDYDNR